MGEEDNTTYFWVRVYDYNYKRDRYEKGVLLDEFYIKDIDKREEAKQIVRERYSGKVFNELKFAKPQKKDGVYAIVMESSEHWYHRFYDTIDTYCFWCHKPIKGKMSEFPHTYLSYHEGDFKRETTNDDRVYFCNYYDCKNNFYKSLKYEGEFQEKEAGRDGEIFGYIYHIYNRTTDTHYIGQTRYMPFFRWQEHIKDGKKGNITDLSFDVITEVRRNRQQSDDQNQQYLNSIEAWWITKFKEEKYKTCNVTKPRITVEHLKEKFEDMLAKQRRLEVG